jgi:hypothetical protein
MSTATTTTSHDTGQQTSPRGRQREAQQPATQLKRSAANRLRTTMAAVRLAFTWLGVRKTLAPEQRTTAARAFHADREFLSASKLILELQRLTAHLAERLTGLHDGQPKVFRDSAVENLREFFERLGRPNIRSSPELDAHVEQAQRTINGIEPQTLRDSNRLRQMVARDFEQIQASVGDLLVDRPRRNILRRGGVGGAV